MTLHFKCSLRMETRFPPQVPCKFPIVRSRSRKISVKLDLKFALTPYSRCYAPKSQKVAHTATGSAEGVAIAGSCSPRRRARDRSGKSGPMDLASTRCAQETCSGSHGLLGIDSSNSDGRSPRPQPSLTGGRDVGPSPMTESLSWTASCSAKRRQLLNSMLKPSGNRIARHGHRL